MVGDVYIKATKEIIKLEDENVFKKGEKVKKVFITGESGTIPMQMQRLASKFDFEVINTQLEENFLTHQKTHQSFKIRRPEINFLQREFLLGFDELWNNVDLIIHSGAFVGTDYCNSDPSMAIKTNVGGTQNIVDICNKFDIPLVYLSTTAILDPKEYSFRKPMVEDTPINPQTIYGITKYTGELIVKNTCKTERVVLRPVFGFGNYPDDLHSALTKLIYVMYKNFTQNTTNKLKILLDKNIPKSYTRVENIASCILSIAGRRLYRDECSVFNIGEDYSREKNWYQLFSIISFYFVKHGICTEMQFNQKIDEWIEFDSTKDYLHYHNINNDRLRSIQEDFTIKDEYISIDQGITLTIDSVIKNIELEPYWL